MREHIDIFQMLHSNSTTRDVSDRSGPSSRWARDSPNEGPDRSEMSRVVLLLCNIIMKFF